jgi:hypothetical protein
MTRVPPASAVGLSDIATHTADGAPAAAVRAPYSLTFVPNERLRADMPDRCTGPVTDYFKTIPPGAPHATRAHGSSIQPAPRAAGTTIFHVLGTPDPCALPVPIGYIRVISSPTTSVYGDTKLFFKHQVRGPRSSSRSSA